MAAYLGGNAREAIRPSGRILYLLAQAEWTSIWRVSGLTWTIGLDLNFGGLRLRKCLFGTLEV